MRMQMEMRLLKCELTDEEAEAKGRELARVCLSEWREFPEVHP